MIVVDSSAVMSVLLDEEQGDLVLSAISSCEVLHAPALLPYEVLNVGAGALRRRKGGGPAHAAGDAVLVALADRIRALTRQAVRVTLAAEGEGSARRLRDVLAGEGIDDLAPFDAEAFVDGLLGLAREEAA